MYMKKLFILILCVAVGCSSSYNEEYSMDGTDTKIEETYESDTELDEYALNVIQEKLFLATSIDAPKENLPEWLIVKINEIEELYFLATAKIYKGEWNNSIVYIVRNGFDSCLFCDVYFEEGTKVLWTADDISFGSFSETSKDWTVIYKFGEFDLLF